VKKLSEVSSEITYQIPTAMSGKFKDFFDEFDNSLDHLGLRSYGISVTTLEEVFLKVGHPDNLEEKPESLKEENTSNGNESLEKKSKL
jgi:ATP-binding cassette subfamily A (ABC1) protein 3